MTSLLLPADDDFADGAGLSSEAYGITPDFYICVRPWASDTVTGFSIATRQAILHNGYSPRESGGVVLPGANVRYAASAYGDPTTLGEADDLFTGYLWRNGTWDEGRVTGRFTLHAEAGTPGSDSMRYVGVCGRSAPASHSDGTDPPQTRHFTRDEGYWFLVANKSGVGTKYLLIRTDATGPVLLDSATTTLSDLAMQYGRTLRLHIADNGSGHPVLTATTTTTRNMLGQPSETTVFSYTDTDANKITRAGHWGFGMTQGRVESGIQTVPLIGELTIEDASAPVVIDNWKRQLPRFCQTSPVDEIGVSGRDLACSWLGTNHSNFRRNHFERDTTAGDRVLISNDQTGILLSQRPATVSYESLRSCRFIFTATSAGLEEAAGVVCRGRGRAASSFRWDAMEKVWGYALVVSWAHDSSAWLLRLYSLEDTSQLVVADYTPGGLAHGTAFTLELSIVNEGGTTPETGTPKIRAKLDGAVVTWDNVYLSGTSQVGDYVYDTRSTRHENGTGEGVVLWKNGVGTHFIVVDDWTEGSLSAGGPSSDYASISIPGEADGATGTLSTPLDWGWIEDSVAGARVFRYESGYLYRIARATKERRSWTARVAAMSQTVRDALVTFWNAHDGSVIPFNWTTPDGEAVIACFDQDELGDRKTGPDSYSVELSLLELFS